MKKIIILVLAVTISKTFFTQGVGVNESGAAADGSAILDVSSTTKGLLVPRMPPINDVKKRRDNVPRTCIKPSKFKFSKFNSVILSIYSFN